MAVEDRVYLDEAGVEDTLDYAYGWSLKGTRCWGEKLGHRTQRVSMAAAWCCGQVLAPLTFEGYCDSALIEAWFEQHLIRELHPGQVVILDNASFHPQQRLREILATVGCTLRALPAYSPGLNTIEPGALWADGTPSNIASGCVLTPTLPFARKSMLPSVAYNMLTAIFAVTISRPKCFVCGVSDRQSTLGGRTGNSFI